MLRQEQFAARAFEDVLDEVWHAGLGEEGEDRAFRMTSDGFWNVLSTIEAAFGPTAADQAREGYALHAGSSPDLRPFNADPAMVAEELGPLDGLSVEELKRLRRRFAATNHPDLFGPQFRETANRRMTVANALIDGALKAAS
ncbi:hypothetical protein [Consotaella salsifontis]|uniref:J domain-containing protein n=1 Tax=Consotaella salsifontis TaxID=1365950 RepID=A0A1T4QY27_9HYPH|nr:hypothetical protein [Consotaella salsifontis]SKA08248.1 hypothetical protein SAMN05428963_105315 [Consotaella salsifontis]